MNINMAKVLSTIGLSDDGIKILLNMDETKLAEKLGKRFEKEFDEKLIDEILDELDIRAVIKKGIKIGLSRDLEDQVQSITEEAVGDLETYRIAGKMTAVLTNKIESIISEG